MIWLGLALADPVDALDPAAQPFFLKAEAEAEAGRAAVAESMYRLVLERDPAFLPARLGLARALLAQGNAQGAVDHYRDMPEEPEAVEALARLVEPTNPEEARRLWRSLKTLNLGDPTAHGEDARLSVGSDPEAALAAWSMYLTLLQGQAPDRRVFLALVEGLPAEAETLLRHYAETWPEGDAAEEVRLRLDRIDIEAAAAQLDLGGDVPLDAAGLVELGLAERALSAGQVEAGLARAEALVARAPRSAAAHGLYADGLAATGRWAEAEVQARLAAQLAPDDARARARLGWLLHVGYGGRKDAEAAVELRQAVRLRPGEAELRLRVGRVEQALGAWAAAIEAYRTYLELSPDGKDAAAAREALDALTREPPPAPPRTLAGDADLPAAAATHFRIARVLLGKGRRVEARAELATARLLAPDATVLLNEEARLDREDGRLDLAVAGWRRSVALDPEQPDVWRNLGDAAADRTERRRAYSQAATGDADAWYLLAEMAWQDGDWAGVRAALTQFETQARTGSYYREAAQKLRAEADRRYWGLRLGIVGVLLALLAVPVAVWLRRRSAGVLRDLLAVQESWHDAARLLAALRHEVLKHNTTVLPDVADALTRGDPGPWSAYAARAPELTERFDATVEALHSLGRRHGLRLDLVHRDPVLGPMHRAMRRLARLAGRNPDPAEIYALSTTLNVEGYAAIGRMVQELCVLPVEPALVRAVYARVAGEPSFSGAPVPELEMEEDPPQSVRLFRPDLEDILANLLRNALAAGATRIGAAIGGAEDPITGHSLVEIRIWDDAPGTLTNAMIRGRYIARGLGLAVDLVNRHGGAIRVEPTGEGKKAIVVEWMAVEATEAA